MNYFLFSVCHTSHNPCMVSFLVRSLYCFLCKHTVLPKTFHCLYPRIRAIFCFYRKLLLFNSHVVFLYIYFIISTITNWERTNAIRYRSTQKQNTHKKTTTKISSKFRLIRCFFTSCRYSMYACQFAFFSSSGQNMFMQFFFHIYCETKC